MQGRKPPRGDQPGRAATGGDRVRGRFFTATSGAACAAATLCLAAVSAAQSPFTQTPSRSGAFTIPQPSDSTSRGRSTAPPAPSVSQSPFTQTPPRGGTFTIPQPSVDRGRTPPRPGATMEVPLPPLPLLPGGGVPMRPAGLPTTPESALPPPLPGEAEPHDGKLPPKPAVAPELSAAPTGPIPRAAPVLLRAGLTVTLRVCQVLPADGFSPGERLLNGREPIQKGDCFLAEVIDPCPAYPILVGGSVTEIMPPGRFGRPGYVSLQMTQLVQTDEGRTGWIPWRMDLADRRFATRMRRVLLTTLLGLEGAGTGASIGAQFSGGNMSFIGGGMGIGAIVGLGYASFQRGTEANLEPGDTFEIVVGTTHYRPVAREWQTILYPAAEPNGGKRKKP